MKSVELPGLALRCRIAALEISGLEVTVGPFGAGFV
jgi:hypothetical protein